MKLTKEEIKNLPIEEVMDALAYHMGYEFKLSNMVNEESWHDCDGMPYLDAYGYQSHPVPISLDWISRIMKNIPWEKHSDKYFTSGRFCYVNDTGNEYEDRLRLYCLLLLG